MHLFYKINVAGELKSEYNECFENEMNESIYYLNATGEDWFIGVTKCCVGLRKEFTTIHLILPVYWFT